MSRLPRTVAWLVSGLALSSGSTLAQNIENGRRLHEQHCLRCHTARIYTRADSRIKTLDDLRRQVSHCELGQELTWFPEEVDDVTAWLDAVYYHLSEK